MKKEQRLTKRGQFATVYSQGKAWANSFAVLRAFPNGLTISRWGLSVSRAVGKAVVRNKVKRRLREVVRQMIIAEGWDLVLIARKRAAEAQYSELERATRTLLTKAGLLPAAGSQE